MATLGVIGGSGFYKLDWFEAAETIDLATPFGRPSAPLRIGRFGHTDVIFVARHGKGHKYSPSDIPYRANIYALKELGATHLLSLSAVGSLRNDLPPRSLLLPDQIIDRTVSRERTFFDGGIVAHVGLADPFCEYLQGALLKAARSIALQVELGGTYVCIEGPQFSTRAESELYRSWGGAVIGMTAMPEARLAREAELCYATLAMVTDFDVWHESEADVSVEVVMSNLTANSVAASSVMRKLVEDGMPNRACGCQSALDHAIVTDPTDVPEDTQRRVAIFTGERLAEN